jgi:hypothetical protein
MKAADLGIGSRVRTANYLGATHWSNVGWLVDDREVAREGPAASTFRTDRDRLT